MFAEGVQHHGCTQATGLLVIREREVHGSRERHLRISRRERQCTGDEAFHIAASAAKRTLTGIVCGEWIGIPGLALYRDDIGVTRQHHTPVDIRAQSPKDVGLTPVRIVGERRAGACVFEHLLCIMNEIQI